MSEPGSGLDRKITVPFCPESELSGIVYMDFMPAVWYLCLPKIPSLFIYMGLRTMANSRETTRNDTTIRKSWSR